MNTIGQKNIEQFAAASFKRAHGEEQKQMRITQFLDTAGELYDTCGYENVSLTLISQKLNFHRNNVYNYFHCKEDLFLALLLRDLNEAIADAINTFNTNVQAEEFASEMTKLLLRHQRLLDLFALANTTMLAAASPYAHKYFINEIKNIQDKLVQHLDENNILAISNEKIIALFRDINHFATGIYPNTIEYKERHHIPCYPDLGYGNISFQSIVKRFIKEIAI
ncbi:MAG: TetR/AcrR family transcriptional regulator [Phascolarctobacterium sp.]|nr:TetR/AcrR family transcriptional regulator [Phascolarctobacterium sp.]